MVLNFRLVPHPTQRFESRTHFPLQVYSVGIFLPDRWIKPPSNLRALERTFSIENVEIFFFFFLLLQLTTLRFYFSDIDDVCSDTLHLDIWWVNHIHFFLLLYVITCLDTTLHLWPHGKSWAMNGGAGFVDIAYSQPDRREKVAQ